MTADDLLAGLPGEALIRQGLRDVATGRQTPEALLVAIARPRLTGARLLPAVREPWPEEPERSLYQLLCAESGDAYARYNALLRELTSFESALDHRLRRAASGSAGQ
jgi:hypothetical protein